MGSQNSANNNIEAAAVSNDTSNQQQLSENSTNPWGQQNQEVLADKINSIYEEIVFWRMNLFDLPNSAAGKSFVRESTRLIENWTDMSEISGIALKALMVMPALLLQKPTRKSSSKNIRNTSSND